MRRNKLYLKGDFVFHLNMFDDWEAGGSDITSTWRTRTSLAIQGCQTDPIPFEEVATQSVSLAENGSQTLCLADQLAEVLKSKRPDSSNDHQRLLSFLTESEPIVSRQLLRNVQYEYQLMGSYVPVLEANDLAAEEGKAGEFQHVAACLAVSASSVPVRDMSWDRNGYQLAVAHGHSNHNGVCSHHGWLCLWQFSLLQRLDRERPYISYESEGCLTCVCFNPSLQTIAIAANYNGEVMLFDFSNEEEGSDILLASSRYAKERFMSSECFHYDAVTSIRWIPKKQLSTASTNSPWSMTMDSSLPADLRLWSIISCGVDGKLIVWEIDLPTKQIRPTRALQLLQSDILSSLPRFPQYVSCFEVTTIQDELNGVHQLVVFGTDTGFVLVIEIEALALLDTRLSKLPTLASAVKLQTLRTNISSRICSIASCPINPNMILVCSREGIVQVWDMKNPKSSTMECQKPALSKVGWHALRRDQFILVQPSGLVSVYKPDRSRLSVVGNFQAQGDEFYHQLAVASGPSHYLALADRIGRLHVFRSY